MKKSESKARQTQAPAETRALVPIAHETDIAEGIQAYRRGDMIIYTIRGEPEVVEELMGELGRQGVGQVVALISHAAPAELKTPYALEKPDSAGPEG